MKRTKLEIALIIILLLLVGGVAGFLIGQGGRTPMHLRPSPRRQAWTINDLSRIQAWLTFDYLNFVFRLPPTYLEGKLPTPDSHYPNISIESYADRHGLGHTQFLETVRGDVSSYLNPPSVATSTATST